MSIWVIPLLIDMGYSVAHVYLGPTIRNRHGLLGCSCPFGSNHQKQTWVARLLMSIWVKPLEIDMGCSVAHDNVMMCKNIEPTLMGGLLISCSCCSVAFQSDPPNSMTLCCCTDQSRHNFTWRQSQKKWRSKTRAAQHVPSSLLFTSSVNKEDSARVCFQVTY